MKKLQYTTNDPAASTDYLAGDNTWKTIPGGSTTTSKSFMGVLQGSTVSSLLTSYGCFNYQTLSPTEAGRIFVVPYACTVSRFYVRIFSAQSGLGALTFTVRKNGVDTSIVVTIAAGSAANTEANSGTSSATYSAGDDLGFKVVNSAGAVSANIHNTSIMVEI